MTISQRIFLIMKEKKLKQKELAAYTGISTSAISAWNKNNTNPAAESLSTIADFLNVSVAFLLTGEEKSPSLPADEQELLTYYKKLPEQEKIRLVSRAETLADVYAEQQKAIEMTSSNSPDADEPETVTLHYFDDAASAGTGMELGEGNYSDLQANKNAFTSKADIVIRVKGNSMQPQFNDGDLVLVRLTPVVEDNEIGIFRIGGAKGYIKKKGADRLISLNAKYDDIPFDGTEEIEAIGRVIGVLKPEWIIQ